MHLHAHQEVDRRFENEPVNDPGAKLIRWGRCHKQRPEGTRVRGWEAGLYDNTPAGVRWRWPQSSFCLSIREPWRAVTPRSISPRGHTNRDAGGPRQTYGPHCHSERMAPNTNIGNYYLTWTILEKGLKKMMHISCMHLFMHFYRIFFAHQFLCPSSVRLAESHFIKGIFEEHSGKSGFPQAVKCDLSLANTCKAVFRKQFQAPRPLRQ